MIKRLIHTGLLAAALFFGAGMDATSEAQALSAGSVYARLDVQGLGDLQEAWGVAMGERAQMVSELKSLSAQYRAEVDAIDALKQDGVSNLSRRALERRLRDARAIAEKLDELQSEVLRRDALMSRISVQIVGLLDAERAQLERRLIKGDSSKALITTLNELSAERELYVQPLPGFDRQRYADVLKDANDVQDPDDMLAMADELLDAEGEVRAQMNELEGQLKTLRTRRKLLRRANDFRREERFFEEGDRARTFGTRTRVNTPSRKGDPEESGAEDLNEGTPPESNTPPTAAPDEAGEPVVAEADDYDGVGFQGLDGPEAGASDPDTVSEDGGAADRGTGGMAPDPGLTDNPGTVGVPVETPSADPFGTPTDVIIVERQADPNVSMGSSDVPDTQIDGQIKSLETEREELDRKARELRRQAKQLKRRATEVD